MNNTNLTEKIFRLKDASKYIKKTYQLDVAPTRLIRWISEGLVSYSGHRVVLRATKKFGMWYTTNLAIDNFIMEQGR